MFVSPEFSRAYTLASPKMEKALVGCQSAV
jgi:hypothetical protein